MPIKASTVVTLLTPSYTLKPATSVATIYVTFILVTDPTSIVATIVTGGFSVTILKGFNGQS
jgi:hypothetical protein